MTPIFIFRLRYALLGGLMLAGFSVGHCEQIEWHPGDSNDMIGLDPAIWEPCPTPVINVSSGGVTQGGRELNQALPISAFAPGPQNDSWPGVIVFGIKAEADKPVTLVFRFSQIGRGYTLPQRLAIGWNEDISDSVFPAAAEFAESHLVERKIMIPAAKVRNSNFLWVTLGYGEIGLASLTAESDSPLSFLKEAEIRQGMEGLASRCRPLPVRASGEVLLLSTGNRKDTVAFRKLVLDPMGVSAEETTITEWLPATWPSYKMVVVSSWALAPLLEEDVLDILAYVEGGGKLYLNGEGYLRLSRSVQDRHTLDQSLFGARLGGGVTLGFGETGEGYLDFSRGESPWARFVGLNPEMPLDRILPSGSELISLFDFAPEGAVITVPGRSGEERAAGLFHAQGQGWIYVDGFSYLQPETINLARKLVEAALSDSSTPR